MYARIGTWQGGSDELEQWIERSRTQVLPGVREVPGSVGVLLLLDRAGRRALTVTLWQDEAAMRSSEDRRASLQAGTQAATGATVETSRYEVVDASW